MYKSYRAGGWWAAAGGGGSAGGDAVGARPRSTTQEQSPPVPARRMAAPSAAAEAVAALHLLLPRRRGLQGAEDDEEGWPGWLVALLCICGMCCMFAAIGKYRFEADGQRCSSCLNTGRTSQGRKTAQESPYSQCLDNGWR